MTAPDTRQTSADALAALDADLPRLRRMVHEAIRAAGERGLTADEAAERLGLSPLSVRPRCTELSQGGQIRDSGERRINASGKGAIAWIAT